MDKDRWLLYIALIFTVIGAGSILVALLLRLFKVHSSFTRLLRILMVVGSIFIPTGFVTSVVAIVLSAMYGRSTPLLNQLMESPSVAVMSSVDSSKLCDDNGLCDQYCCTAMRDKTFLWKDCDPACESVQGLVGVPAIEHGLGTYCFLHENIPNFCAQKRNTGKAIVQLVEGCSVGNDCVCCEFDNTPSGFESKYFFDCEMACIGPLMKAAQDGKNPDAFKARLSPTPDACQNANARIMCAKHAFR